MHHALMYQGSFEQNFPNLTPGAETFISTDGSARELPEWPDDVNGIRVGYMEKAGKRFVAVRLQFEEHDIVLHTPVVLDPIRHLGSRRFAPEAIIVTDDLAEALLDDAIECNPEQADELALLINRVNQVRRGSAHA
jgi:hypothetical protein